MGARRRLRARGPASLATLNAHNKHAALTYEDIRYELEAAARRDEARAKRDVAEQKEPTN